MTLQGARHALDEAGLELSRGPSLNNPRMRAGHVLTQEPLAGQEAARGTPVRVFLSDGPDRRKIPGIAGMEKDEAINEAGHKRAPAGRTALQPMQRRSAPMALRG